MGKLVQEDRAGRGNRKVHWVRCPEAYKSMAMKSGYVREHRLVMAQSIGRPLLPTEVVHHIDGDSLSNGPENLILFASQQAHRDYEALDFPPF